MARTYTAYLNSEQIPALEALQAAIKSLGFKLTLDDAYAPMKFSGYLPCTLDGEDAGVTIKFEASQEVTGKDTVITLQWSGDPREQVSAVMITAAFAHAFAATVQDHNRHEISAEALVADARKQFSNLD
jgi:hypothetical protein